MNLNSVIYVAANNKEAIYFDGKLFIEKESFSTKELSSELMAISPFEFFSLVIDEDINEMPQYFDAFNEDVKNPYKINKGDMATFTTLDDNHIVYGLGKVIDVKRDERGFIEVYVIKESNSGKTFVVAPHGKGDAKKLPDTVMLSQKNDKIEFVDLSLTEDVFEQRKALLVPKVGESVSFETKKGAGVGMVKEVSVRPYYASGSEFSYSCKIESEDGSLTEICFGNKRYPEDKITWDNAPEFLSQDKIY